MLSEPSVPTETDMPRSKILALILAGGEGSRLETLTARRAKPATPFAGVYRLIDFPLSNCMHSGISDVWIIEQYESHSINEHLANGRPWDLDRTYGGLRVLPPHQSRDGEGDGFAQGNADALYRNRKFIREWEPDLLLVLSTDHVYTLDYGRVIERHREREAEVTIVTTRVPLEQAGRFGTVLIGADGRVAEFEYKPEQPRWDTVTTEVFVYDAPTLLDTLDRLAGEQTPEEGGEPSLRDFGHELLPRLVERGRAHAFPLDGYWRDLGTLGSYWAAHRDLLAPDPPLRLDDPAWPILSYGTQRLPARVGTSARVENSLLSSGCTVRGTVIRSVLGPGTLVEEGATVRDSILLHDVRVDAGATVERAIVDDGARIGEGARVGEAGVGDDPSAEELVLVGQGVEVPTGERVGAGARIEPGGMRNPPEGEFPPCPALPILTPPSSG